MSQQLLMIYKKLILIYLNNQILVQIRFKKQ
jgi:hypothetical protein